MSFGSGELLGNCQIKIYKKCDGEFKYRENGKDVRLWEARLKYTKNVMVNLNIGKMGKI